MAPEPVTVIHAASGATLVVHPFGATVTSWSPAPGAPSVLFAASRAVYDGSRPIRAGIPIVFPQFANQGPLPAHGFARTSVWAVDHVGDGAVQLSLEDSDATRAVWPHAFKLVYKVAFDATKLTTTLDVINPHASADAPSAPFSFEALLHTYLSLSALGGDISSVRVHGLTGVDYLSKPEGGARLTDAEEGGITFGGKEVDRIYCNTPADVVVSVPGGRGLTVHRSAVTKMAPPGMRSGVTKCPLDVVVWNCGEAKCPTFADFAPEDWKGYVCVEPGRVSPDTAGHSGAHNLEAGYMWSMTQQLSLE